MSKRYVYYKVKKIPPFFKNENTLPDIILKHVKKYRTANYFDSIYAWQLLKRLSGFNLNEVTFLPNGKPIIKDLSISISHSKGYVSVAFASFKTELGIDIEKVKDKSLCFLAKISDKFKNKDNKLLYYLWTEHEAKAKALNLNILKDTSESFYGLTKSIKNEDGEFSLSIYNKGKIVEYED